VYCHREPLRRIRQDHRAGAFLLAIIRRSVKNRTLLAKSLVEILVDFFLKVAKLVKEYGACEQ
jgi:hypothetical protein